MTRNKTPFGIQFISFLFFTGVLGLIVKMIFFFEVLDLILFFVLLIGLIGFMKKIPILYKFTLSFLILYALYLMYFLVVNVFKYTGILQLIQDLSSVLFYSLIAYYLFFRRKYFLDSDYKFNTKSKVIKKQELFFDVILIVLLVLTIVLRIINY